MQLFFQNLFIFIYYFLVVNFINKFIILSERQNHQFSLSACLTANTLSQISALTNTFKIETQ